MLVAVLKKREGWRGVTAPANVTYSALTPSSLHAQMEILARICSSSYRNSKEFAFKLPFLARKRCKNRLSFLPDPSSSSSSSLRFVMCRFGNEAKDFSR